MPSSSTDSVTTALDVSKEVLGFVFSWIVLLGIGVIVSGKLAGQHFILGFSDEDSFSINVVAFRIRARGDEVSLGFLFFFLCLGLVVIFGGADAYTYFKSHAGIDIGHWNSICVISSFLSIVVAVVLWIMRAMFGYQPIVNGKERIKQIEQLKQLSADGQSGASDE
jgi:hypothetical protein